MEQILGFFNFIFTIVPLARSFIRIWYDQLKSHIADSSGVFFDWSPLGLLGDFIFPNLLFFHGSPGFPSILCPVLSMQHLCVLLAFRLKDAFLGHFLFPLRFSKLNYVLL